MHQSVSLTLLKNCSTSLPHSFPPRSRFFDGFNLPCTTTAQGLMRVSDIGQTRDGSTNKPTCFAAAYAELSTGPDTQMVMYSSMEQGRPSDEELPVHEGHIMNLVRTLAKLRKEYAGKLAYGNSLLVGNLHSDVLNILAKMGKSDDTAGLRQVAV